MDKNEQCGEASIASRYDTKEMYELLREENLETQKEVTQFCENFDKFLKGSKKSNTSYYIYDVMINFLLRYNLLSLSQQSLMFIIQHWSYGPMLCRLNYELQTRHIIKKIISLASHNSKDSDTIQNTNIFVKWIKEELGVKCDIVKEGNVCEGQGELDTESINRLQLYAQLFFNSILKNKVDHKSMEFSTQNLESITSDKQNHTHIYIDYDNWYNTCEEYKIYIHMILFVVLWDYLFRIGYFKLPKEKKRRFNHSKWVFLNLLEDVKKLHYLIFKMKATECKKSNKKKKGKFNISALVIQEDIVKMFLFVSKSPESAISIHQ